MPRGLARRVSKPSKNIPVAPPTTSAATWVRTSRTKRMMPPSQNVRAQAQSRERKARAVTTDREIKS